MKLYELIVAELLAVVIAVILSDKNAYEKAHADLSQLIRWSFWDLGDKSQFFRKAAMSKICPETGERVIYLTCLECETKSCHSCGKEEPDEKSKQKSK